MKKRNLKTLSLNKQSISNLDRNARVGGIEVSIDPNTTDTTTTLTPGGTVTTISPMTTMTTATGEPVTTTIDTGIDTGIGSGSQNNSQCGYSCDPNLCGSVEPWGC
jgi:hypothetical protein